MIYKIVVLFIFTLFVNLSIFPQTQSADTNLENPKGSVITFSLDKSDESEDVGFDDKESYWKLKYELWLVDSGKVDNLVETTREEYGDIKSDGKKYHNRKVSKEFHKKIRKAGLLITEGEVRKEELSDPLNRKISIPFTFSEQIQKVLNDAVNSDKKLDFVIRFRTRVEGRTSSGIKLERKIRQEFLYPFKIRYQGNSVAVFYPMFGASIEIRREGNGFRQGLYRL